MALLPWAALTLYLLIARRVRIDVPFVDLWRGPEQASQSNRALHRTPKWVALMLLAALASIFAAGGPAVIRAGGAGGGSTDSPLATIELLAVRDGQCMLRVRNQSLAAMTQLLIETDRGSTTKQLELPPFGQTKDYFMDVDRQANRVRATLKPQTPSHADTSAEVNRQRSWPKVMAAGELPADVRRMIDVYTDRRPASPGSAKVAVATNQASLASDERAILVPSADRPMRGAVEVSAHEVTQNVAFGDTADWAITADAPAGFTPIVTLGGQPVVAVREGSVRQAWVGFNSPGFSRSPALVILWTNLFDYVGNGGDEFAPARLPRPIESPNSSAKHSANASVALGPWLVCLAAVLWVMSVAAIKRR